MPDGFQIGRTLGRAFAGLQPIADGTFNLAGLRKVVRQQFGLARHAVRESPFDGFGDARVQSPSIAAQQCVVRGILNQSVLEAVDGLWWRPALEHQFRMDKPRQSVLYLALAWAGDGGEQFV